MAELQNAPVSAPASGGPQAPGDDPLARLHRMSTTAGVGSTDYVAINPLAVTAFVVGLASALVYLTPVLLVIPIAAIILAIIAIRQISDSNGTQAGKGLAWGGVALGLVFAGIVGALQFQKQAAAGEARQQTARVVEQLDQAIKKRDWQAAYGLFSDEFAQRWDPPKFVERMSGLTSTVGDLRSATAGPRLLLESGPTGTRGVGTITFDFTKAPEPRSLTIEFRQTPEGWQINDIPVLFPPPQEMGPPGAG